MQSFKLSRLVFPEVLMSYFDVVGYQAHTDRLDFWLDEKEFLDLDDYKKGTVRSYGFTPEKVIQDFPLRGKPVFLHVRRRKWRDTSTSEIFSYTYDDLTSEGTKLTPEFVAFLKDTD
ncbi:transposase family protein [Bacteroides sp. 51]|uniref:ISAon1 family transposase N-terminal region protein n=1 Tax=Bacteroides sp. 51 TaxID=2302938 RepID=UPI0013D3DC2B|nr:transposase family protein [Bacteroides sp. 51]NDV82247.1 transposase family protein [Bacteroides sp. 51]